MKWKKYTTEQVVGILREVDAPGNPSEVCRQHGMANRTIHGKKARFGWESVPEARPLEKLEFENAKPKRLLAEAALDNAALCVVAISRSLCAYRS